MTNELDAYLAANGYASLDDWGHDSDYTLTAQGWVDEDGNPVDLYTQWDAAMEADRNFQ